MFVLIGIVIVLLTVLLLFHWPAGHSNQNRWVCPFPSSQVYEIDVNEVVRNRPQSRKLPALPNHAWQTGPLRKEGQKHNPTLGNRWPCPCHWPLPIVSLSFHSPIMSLSLSILSLHYWRYPVPLPRHPFSPRGMSLLPAAQATRCRSLDGWVQDVWAPVDTGGHSLSGVARCSFARAQASQSLLYWTLVITLALVITHKGDSRGTFCKCLKCSAQARPIGWTWSHQWPHHWRRLGLLVHLPTLPCPFHEDRCWGECPKKITRKVKPTLLRQFHVFTWKRVRADCQVGMQNVRLVPGQCGHRGEEHWIHEQAPERGYAMLRHATPTFL